MEKEQNTKPETLTKLNNRWWYRLLKVIYVSVLIYTLIVSTAFAVADTKPEKLFDRNNSKIVCLDGNKNSFSFKELGLFKGSEIDPEDVVRWCNLTTSSPNSEVSDFTNAALRSGEIRDSYQRIEREKTEGSWLLTTAYALITIIIILVLFEVIRRVFYYIFFGTFRPQK